MAVSPKRKAYDDFVRNLEFRGDTDTKIDLIPTLIVVLLPILLYVMVFWGPELNSYLFGRFEYAQLTESVLVMFTLVESLVVATVLSRMYARLISHARRDDGWRSALIDYARACGSDVSGLVALDQEARRIGTFRGEKPMKVAVTLLKLFMVACIFYVMPHSDGFIQFLDLAIVVGVASTLVVFFSVLTKLLVFPYRHETNQVRFVREFVRVTGLEVEPFEPAVRHRSLPLHLVLLFATLGLYIIVLINYVFVSMNKHFKAQVRFEDGLAKVLGSGAGLVSGSESVPQWRFWMKVPPTLFFAELFMLFTIGFYVLKLGAIAMDIDAGVILIYDVVNLPQILSGMTFTEAFRVFLKYFMVFWYLHFMVANIAAMMNLASGKSIAWRNAVRTCIKFTVPAWIAFYLYSPESYTHLFDLNPFITTAVLYVLLIAMMFLPAVRRFYTPATMEVPETRVWLKFLVKVDSTLRENIEEGVRKRA